MSKKILVIDDDDLIRGLVTHALQLDGYTVVTAPSGPTGITQFKAEKPDLVMLDIAMPGMNGFEVATQLREFEKEQNLAHTTIIVFTAYARSFMATPDDDLRIDSYLTKPIDPKKLLKHVHQFLDDEEKSETPGQ
ncbi:MAG: response regulator [Anaerolineae bacterium]|nr:response regulator [Anaerolineae bacterium]